ncbi:MAG: tyrosine--tRNA ligase [Candidatus Nephthysia bennettiae]|uniref:Tyrosine--tRNA ligase n=1 Tax=Candidatus Nephthysia bennettiae TaxID=3127016 RepID=A0A934N569_9BACT|nr:tyrosine--tRNA ligase [Candidatus Dormibacteraeota bacterium]MBJ7611202.1 tyrosine--tRNA ligase [Candidatus Dormibacteraeota bacterium]PZR85807.1 MAG: tyrosine--tRNA ligase [Candidatus Dormibacteraeota bacterium]
MSESLWEWLRARAVEIHVADNLCQRVQRGEKLRVKLGVDPTAPDLHVGHLVVFDVLRAFQEEGHLPVLIVGDYTAMIGDPSGRSETRPVLSREQVEANARTYFDQIYKVLDPDRTEVHGNSEWLAGMDAADILRLLGTQTLQSVLQREDFATRLREGLPVGAHEILYPFNQGYDSVAVRADLEIGGTDQLFNLLFGREVQRAYGQPPQDVAVFPLLEGLDGHQKMSKSLGNYIGVAEPPEEIYGKTMSIPDALTEKYLRLVSGLSPEEVESVLARGPRDAKASLARRLVGRLHGEEAAAGAEEDFDRRFRRREVPTEVADHRPAHPSDLAGTLVELGWYPTRSAARRVAEQGGVRINGERRGADAELRDGDLLQAGRRNIVRIHLG